MPDPVGLVMQAFIGTVFLNSNAFYATFLFAWIHYTIVWMTMGVISGTFDMQHEFMVRMMFLIGWGTFLGIGLSIVMGTRALIPGDTFRRGVPQLGIFMFTFFIQAGMRAVFVLTGAHRVAANFPPDPADPAVWWGYLATLLTSIGGAIAIVYLTYTQMARRGFLSWFTVSYEDGMKSRYIVWYGAALAMVLSPQALWDFLVLPPTGWVQWHAGLLTTGVTIVMWIIVYWFFGTYLRIDKTHFSAEQSRVSWHQFVLTTGGFHIALHIYYLIAAEFGSTPADSDTVFTIYIVLAFLVMIFLYFYFKKLHRVRLSNLSKGAARVPLL